MSTQQRKPHASYHYVTAINGAVEAGDAAVKRVLRKLVREAIARWEAEHHADENDAERIVKELVR